VRHAQDTVEIHEQMIEALRRRDVKRYRRLVDDHVRGPRDLYMSRLVAPPPAAARPAAGPTHPRRASARPRRRPRLTRRAKESQSR